MEEEGEVLSVAKGRGVVLRLELSGGVLEGVLEVGGELGEMSEVGLEGGGRVYGRRRVLVFVCKVYLGDDCIVPLDQMVVWCEGV